MRRVSTSLKLFKLSLPGNFQTWQKEFPGVYDEFFDFELQSIRHLLYHKLKAVNELLDLEEEIPLPEYDPGANWKHLAHTTVQQSQASESSDSQEVFGGQLNNDNTPVKPSMLPPLAPKKISAVSPDKKSFTQFEENQVRVSKKTSKREKAVRIDNKKLKEKFDEDWALYKLISLAQKRKREAANEVQLD